MQTAINPLQTNTTTQTMQPQIISPHIDITPIEYIFFGSLLVLCAGIIGWFVKSSFRALASSNIDLKNSIEKLASLVSTIHTDLIEYKTEVAENYASKTELRDLKKDIKNSCVLRHDNQKRRIDDEDSDDGMGF